MENYIGECSIGLFLQLLLITERWRSITTSMRAVTNPTYNNPKPKQSIRAENMISFISSSVFKWTGKVMTRSQVDVVGLHLQPAGQPCKNWHWIFFGNPSGGMFLAPVNHFNMRWTLIFSISIAIKKILLMETLSAYFISHAPESWGSTINFIDLYLFIDTGHNLPCISTLCMKSQKYVNVSASFSRFTWFSLCLTSNESIRELAVTGFPLPITKTVSQTVGFARIDASNPYVWRPSSSCNNWGNILPTCSFKQIELHGDKILVNKVVYYKLYL